MKTSRIMALLTLLLISVLTEGLSDCNYAVVGNFIVTEQQSMVAPIGVCYNAYATDPRHWFTNGSWIYQCAKYDNGTEYVIQRQFPTLDCQPDNGSSIETVTSNQQYFQCNFNKPCPYILMRKYWGWNASDTPKYSNCTAEHFPNYYEFATIINECGAEIPNTTLSQSQEIQCTDEGFNVLWYTGAYTCNDPSKLGIIYKQWSVWSLIRTYFHLLVDTKLQVTFIISVMKHYVAH